MLTVKLTVPDSTRAAPLAQHLKAFAEANGWQLRYTSRLGYVMEPPESELAPITSAGAANEALMRSCAGEALSHEEE